MGRLKNFEDGMSCLCHPHGCQHEESLWSTELGACGPGMELLSEQVECVWTVKVMGGK